MELRCQPGGPLAVVLTRVQQSYSLVNMVVPWYTSGMKLSISLSDGASTCLKELVAARNSNASLVLEASLLRFAGLPQEEQQSEIRRLHNERKATSRDAWMRVFWTALAEEFGVEDFDFTGHGNPFAPRHHGGFNIVFLYDERTPTSGPIYVHAFQNPPQPDNRSLIQNWVFEKDQPVYGAARKVASWIRDHAPTKPP